LGNPELKTSPSRSKETKETHTKENKWKGKIGEVARYMMDRLNPDGWTDGWMGGWVNR
jgi:hypothetical protein